MNILFLTRKFAPQNYIGAVRPTKLAKYLSRQYNCQVDVICMQDNSNLIDPIGIKDIKDIHAIHTLPGCKWSTVIKEKYEQKASKIKAEAKNKKTDNHAHKTKLLKSYVISLIHNIARNILFLVSIYDSYWYGRKAVQELKKGNTNFDAVFSTTTLIESYIVGKWLKKNNPQIKWIYDLRDPIRISQYPGLSKLIMKRVLSKTVPLVDEVTGVSQACIQEFIDAGHPKAQVILNGYDPEDLNSDNSEMSDVDKGDKFKIVYTGSLYDGKRDVTPLLLLLLELSQQNIIDLNKIELHYAGKDVHVLQNALSNTKVNIRVVYHGFIPRDESIKLQLSADALLLLSWNNTGDIGVVTGKFYEYLMMNRPIWCIIKGNEPNSILREMISDAGVGTCYEEADPETHQTAKEYIKDVYQNKFSNKVKGEQNKAVERYNYQNLAGEIFLLCSKN